jgi:hypothetical protein
MNYKAPDRFATTFILPLVCYTLLTLWLTQPLASQTLSHLAGMGTDPCQNLWNFWWIKTSIFVQHTNPFFSSYMYAPGGVPLYFHTLNLPDGLLALPLTYFFGLLPAYNLMNLFAFIFSGYAMYLLVFSLTGDRLASFISGAIYTFSPFHFSHGLGHLTLISMEWVPLFMLFWMKTFQKKGLFFPLGAAICLVLAALTSWYFLIFAGWFALCHFLYTIASKSRQTLAPGWVQRGVFIGAVFLLLMAPVIVGMVHALRTDTFEGGHNAAAFSADLLAYFIPGPVSSYGEWFQEYSARWRLPDAENGLYLGYGVLLLSLLAFRKSKKDAWLWLLLAGTSVLFSLGPYLHVNGEIFRGLPLPYFWFEKIIPLFRLSGCPLRWGFLVMLSTSILAGLAIRDCQAPGAAKYLGFISPYQLVASLALVFILLEFFPTPFAMTKLDIPQFYQQIAQSSEDYTILDLSQDALGLCMQTIHGKKIIGGYISRRPARTSQFLETAPVISQILHYRMNKELKFLRLDPIIAFNWGESSPNREMLGNDYFSISWQGQIEAPVDGVYEFWTTSNDGAMLKIDDSMVINDWSIHWHRKTYGKTELRQGWHKFQLDYFEEDGPAEIALEWAPPQSRRSIVPRKYLKTVTGQPGITGGYFDHISKLPVDREEALKILSSNRIRYIIKPTSREEPIIERDLALPLVFAEEGIKVYEVPKK